VTHTYNILLTGQFNEGTDAKQAIAAFAAASGISVEKAQALFTNAPSVIKKNVDETTAKNYQAKLSSLGIQTKLEAVAPESSAEATPSAKSNSAKKQTIHFSFSGKGYEYFKIWIVNILLVIVTLGLYSPWAKVRNTQYFYGNTTLNGASFAFTADPVKMLIGRLIALGIFILIAALQYYSPLTSLLVMLPLVFVFPWVLNKSLAFYALNSTYRNIRFRFTGTYWPAFKTFFLWPIAATFTFMLLMPIAIQRQQAYIANHHNYGNKSFTFGGKIGDFYKIFLIAIACVVVGAIAGAVLGFIFPPLMALGIAAGYICSIIYFIVAINNLFFNKLNLADHDFKANFDHKDYGLIMIGNFILTIITLGLYIPWAKVKLANYAAEHTSIDVNGDLDKFIAVSQEAPSAFGEEFGDVFDMNVGF